MLLIGGQWSVPIGSFQSVYAAHIGGILSVNLNGTLDLDVTYAHFGETVRREFFYVFEVS